LLFYGDKFIEQPEHRRVALGIVGTDQRGSCAIRTKHLVSKAVSSIAVVCEFECCGN
jgi:hypothetical protein